MTEWKKGKNGPLQVSTPKGRVISVKQRNGSVTTRVEWNPAFAARMNRAGSTTLSNLTQVVARDTDKFVLFQTGMLKNTAQIASEYENGLIVYSTPYARRQYYLHPQGTDLHGDTGLRGSYWGQRSKGANMSSWETTAHARIKKESKK